MPEFAPEIIDTAFSTSSGTSHTFSLPPYLTADDLYILWVTWAIDAATAQASPISGNINNFTVTDTPETAWLRRQNLNSSNDLCMFRTETWTGSMFSVGQSEAQFTTNVSCTAAAIGASVNSHTSSASPVFDFGVQLNYDPDFGQNNGNVNHLGDLGYAEVEPQLYIDGMFGKVSDLSGGPFNTVACLGTSPVAGPSGYHFVPGGEGGTVLGNSGTLHAPIANIAWRTSSGQSSENPGAWTWDEVNDDTNPGNGANIDVPFLTLSFEDYTPDEDEFPYWGILGAMA